MRHRIYQIGARWNDDCTAAGIACRINRFLNGGGVIRLIIGRRAKRGIRHIKDDAVFHGNGCLRLDLFAVVGVVGITRLHRNGLALFSDRQGVTAAGRAGDGLVIGEPLVLHAAARHPILIVDMGGQFATDFCLAADGNRAVLICRRRGNVGRLARRGFVVPGVVFVGRLHGDFVPGVIFTERIGTAVGLVDGLTVA